MVLLVDVEQVVEHVDWALVAESFLSVSLEAVEVGVVRRSASSSNKRASSGRIHALVSVDRWNAALAGRKKSQKLEFSFSTGGSARSSAHTPTRSGKKCLHIQQQCRSLKQAGQLL